MSVQSTAVEGVPSTALLRRNADLVVDILSDAGIDTVYGLPGGTIAPIFDALIGRDDVRLVNATHENMAVFAAAGHAAQTGKPGIVLVTSGPGLLNAMTAIASAYMDGLPVVVLVGEVARANVGRLALQEGTQHGLDVASIVRPITKMVECVTQPSLLPALLVRALAVANSGRRGPVVLTLPIDVLRANIRMPAMSSSPRVEFGVDASTIADVVQCLDDSERVLILAGNGCRNTETSVALQEIAERLGCAVATTPKGKGVFPESHPLSVGVIGTGGHPSAYRRLAQGVDTLLAVGTSLGELATDGWTESLTPHKHMIQIDVEARNIGRNYPVTHAIVGRAERVLPDIHSALRPRPHAVDGFGIETDPANELLDTKRITAPVLLRAVQAALPEDTIFNSDIGEHLLFATHFLRIDRPDSWLVMSGLGSMGSGIGSAIGLQLANTHRRVVCVCGDGGMMMSLGELSTIAREKLPIIFLVMNDERFGMVELGNLSVYGRTDAFPIASTNLDAIVRAMGLRALRIDNAAQTADLPAALSQRDGALVIDARVDRRSVMRRNKRFESLCGVPARKLS